MDELEWNKPDPEGQILYDSINMKYFTDKGNRTDGPRGWEGMGFHMYTDSVWDDENHLEMATACCKYI